MTTGRTIGSLAVALALSVAPAWAYHASDMIIGSTTSGGGALAIRYDFANVVHVSPSFVGATQTLYSGTDPGWDAVFPSEPPLYLLTAGTPVHVQITALDPGVSLKVGADTLDAVGKGHTLGTIDASGTGLHVHPEWRLLLANGVTGDYHIAFQLTTTAPAYSASVEYTATVTNVPASTTTTLASSTTSTSSSSTTVTTSTTSTSESSTTIPPSSTTSSSSTTTSTTSTSSSSATVTTSTSTSSSSTTATSPPGTTSTTVPPATDLLPGTVLALRTRTGAPAKSKLSLIVQDPSVTLPDGVDDDPTRHGGTLRVASETAGFDDTYALPAAAWKAGGKTTVKSYHYADGPGIFGPVRSVVVTRGKGVKVRAKGRALGHALGANAAPVAITLTLGTHRYCLTFGGVVTWKPDVSLVAKHAPAPVACAP